MFESIAQLEMLLQSEDRGRKHQVIHLKEACVKPFDMHSLRLRILLQAMFPDYELYWEYFELFEHLRKLTIWAALDSEVSAPESLSSDLATHESFLTRIHSDSVHWLANPDDDSPQAVNGRATARLAQCLASLVTTLRLCQHRVVRELLVAERMNVKYLCEELLDIYLDTVIGEIGLGNYTNSGEEQQLLCKIVEAIFEGTLLLGEDSIGNTFSEDQAHIMSGRLYFSEMVKVIDYLRPDDTGLIDLPIQEMTREQREERVRETAIDDLRSAAGFILQYANGDPETFKQSNEFTQLQETTRGLAEVARQLNPSRPADALLRPVVDHVHHIAERIVGGDEEDEGEQDEEDGQDGEDVERREPSPDEALIWD
ncbi:hypothetical protein PRZ48_002036 [Zasmidium cellare]|uniref:Uncharacterized protein n=1 Tax=Zasmidium cellare TaxID=395010 RepID=A0ABR0F5K7_ZASCE|nr:hypothetical protein PRZ48_002036 [Zasmidium cellare]